MKSRRLAPRNDTAKPTITAHRFVADALRYAGLVSADRLAVDDDWQQV